MATNGFDEYWKKKVFVETMLYNLKTFFFKALKYLNDLLERIYN